MSNDERDDSRAELTIRLVLLSIEVALLLPELQHRDKNDCAETIVALCYIYVNARLRRIFKAEARLADMNFCCIFLFCSLLQ